MHTCDAELLLGPTHDITFVDQFGSPNWAYRPQQGSQQAETEQRTLGDGFQLWETWARSSRQLWNRYDYGVDMRQNLG